MEQKVATGTLRVKVWAESNPTCNVIGRKRFQCIPRRSYAFGISTELRPLNKRASRNDMTPASFAI